MVFNRSLGNGKNQSSSSVRARARKICITSIASFGLFWPKLASVFPSRNFWFCRETLATIRDQSAMLGEHLSQKVMRDHAQNPKNWQKQGGGMSKNGSKKCLHNFVKNLRDQGGQTPVAEKSPKDTGAIELVCGSPTNHSRPPFQYMHRVSQKKWLSESFQKILTIIKCCGLVFSTDTTLERWILLSLWQWQRPKKSFPDTTQARPSLVERGAGHWCTVAPAAFWKSLFGTLAVDVF